MAYDARQRQIMAYALALSGGNVAAAVRWLKANSAEVGDVGDSTLRRLRDNPEFESEIEHQQKIIRDERDGQIREAERTRFKREVEGTFFERMRSMEQKGWELFEKISGEMEKPGADPKQLLRFWHAAQAFAIDLRKQAGGGIHELWQAEVLVTSTREELIERFGLALADQVLKSITKRYGVKATERQAKEAASGKEENAAV